MKRSLCIENISTFTRSKRPRLSDPLPPVKRSLPWVSATSTKNFMTNDGLLDVFKMYHNNGNKSFLNYKSDTINNYLMARGIEFEKELVKYIDHNRLKSIYVSDIINDKTVQQTIEYMKQGVPLIHSAPVRNKRNGTQGVIDILIRSDYLCNIVEENPLTEEEQSIPAPKLNGKYHYVVVDIKFSTLSLRSDGRHLLNDPKYKAYKAQLYIYNKAISLIQGYFCRYAFILGRRWKYRSKGEIFSNSSCLNKLGVIDFEGVDSNYVNKTQDAIKWVRDVIRHGKSWKTNPPSREELYPNMCTSLGVWDKKKNEIAMNIGEISMLWYCGVKQRQIGFSNGIKSWKNIECTAEKLGIKGKRGDIINKMIDINRQEIDMIRPDKIKTTINDWRTNTSEVFVDFETLMDICSPLSELPEQRKTDMIFMIGVYYTCSKNNVSLYKSFIAKEMSPQEEYRVMDEFVTFMKYLGYPKMWFWDAEQRFWDIAERKQFERLYNNLPEDEKVLITDNISDNWGKIEKNWYDVAEIFRSEPIVIKGCFGFGLKNISEQMRKYDMITERIVSECNSGTSAMVKAIHAYENSDDIYTSSIMKDIESYNRFDCAVLYDILKYLRENH